jgi:hypothetical protein
VEESDLTGEPVALGARGGILSGDLRDNANQQPIPKGKVTIRDAMHLSRSLPMQRAASGSLSRASHCKSRQPRRIPDKPPWDGRTLTLSPDGRRSIVIELTRK